MLFVDWLLVALSSATGIYEASYFLTFGKVFTAAQTGNLLLLGTEALQALDALASAPPSAAGAIQRRYRLTLHRASGPHVVELAESQVPAALRPLVAELLRRRPG